MFARDEIWVESVICCIGKVFGVAFGAGRGGVASREGEQGCDEYSGLPDWACFHGTSPECNGNYIMWLSRIKIPHAATVDDGYIWA